MFWYLRQIHDGPYPIRVYVPVVEKCWSIGPDREIRFYGVLRFFDVIETGVEEQVDKFIRDIWEMRLRIHPERKSKYNVDI